MQRLFNTVCWPSGYQLALACTGLGLTALVVLWLGTIGLRTARVIVRGYPPRRFP